MNFQKEIENWDGKSAKDIAEIYKQHCHDKAFKSNILMLIANPRTQKGSTWLLKHHLENNIGLDDQELNELYNKLDILEYWESKLHILQSLPFLIIPETHKKTLERFLRACLVENNKFVRAWAYNGFYELATQYPEYTQETKAFFEMAMRDEAPSVKARIRNILKKF